MVDMNWFFLLVLALACAPVLGCLWWVVNSKIRDRRRTRIAERMSQTYYHEAVKVPGREPERRSRRSSDARDVETSGERAAIRDTGERAAMSGRERAGWPQDDSSGAGAWPVEEPDPAEPACCTAREVAQHDGPCDCWEDTEIFEVRDGLPAVPMVPRAPRRAAGRPVPGQPPAVGQQPGPPPAAPRALQRPGPPGAPPAPAPGAMPPAASGAPPAGPPPRRPAEWRAPERPQQHPAPRNPVERRPADAPQRPPAARPTADRPAPPRPADRPQRPPAQRRERYQADRREGRPAQRGERRPVERTAARPAPPRRDAWPPADAVEPARSGRHHRD